MDNTSLSHHGIKGMKWGVRRFQNKDGSRTAAGKRRARENASEEPSHDDYKKAHSGKSVKTMSDAELRSRLNRLQMERQYKQLSGSDVNRGKEFVSKTMKAAMGNCITLEDTNGNRKLLKKRYEQKIDAVAAMMDAYIAYKLNRDAFD